MNITTRRKIFPVLEVVELRDNPPLSMAKTALALANSIVLILLGYVCALSYNSIMKSDPTTNMYSDHSDLNNEMKKVIQYEGWLLKDSCKSFNYVYFVQQIACGYQNSTTASSFWCRQKEVDDEVEL
jgi:hypothetical protein